MQYAGFSEEPQSVWDQVWLNYAKLGTADRTLVSHGPTRSTISHPAHSNHSRYQMISMKIRLHPTFLEIIAVPLPASCGWCAACSGSEGPAESPVTRMDGRAVLFLVFLTRVKKHGLTWSKLFELYRILSYI